MSPVSVFAQTARRSARRLAAAGAQASHRGNTFAGHTSYFGGSHHVTGHGCINSVPPLRRQQHSSTVRAIIDAAAVPEPEVNEDDEEKYAARDPKVHSIEGSLAILEGVGGDVKPGTLFDIGNDGATAVLLSHREPKTFALLYEGNRGVDGASKLGASVPIAPGDSVFIRKKSHFYMPSEQDVIGRRVGPLGEPLDGGSVPGGSNRDVASPENSGSQLFREPPSVEDRKPITTPLVTGVKPLDVLTPVGRGQCLLLTGEVGTNLSELGLNAIVAQSEVGDKKIEKNVRCVYGAIGASSFDSGASAMKKLQNAGAVDTTVVSCAPDASLAERYAATCASFAVAEAARAEGKDVLLVLDDFTGLIGFSREMGRLSPQLEIDEDTSEDAPTKEQMVEYEGMIINALLAERRRFLGMTLQRVARMNDKLGGGSLTLMGVMYHETGAYRGKRASDKNSGTVGESGAVTIPSLPTGFDAMPKAMQQKIKAAIDAKKKQAEAFVKELEKANKANALAQKDAPENAHTQPRPLVEEFMSITDGQVFVESFDQTQGWVISAKDSVSRIGSPGAAGPLMSLNMLQLRLDVMQADDMSVFGAKGEEKDGMRDRSAAIRGVLRQTPGSTSKLSEQTVGLYALQKGKLTGMNADEAFQFVTEAIEKARTEIPDVLLKIDEAPSNKLTIEVSKALETLFK